MLCKTCIAVLPNLVVRVNAVVPSRPSSPFDPSAQNQGHSHHKSFHDLALSAQQGCSICCFLHGLLTLSGHSDSQLSTAHGTWWFKRIRPRLLKYYFCSEHQSFEKTIAWNIDKEQTLNRSGGVSSPSAISFATKVLEEQRTVTKSLKQDCEESFAQSRLWITECIASHDACKTRVSSGFLPTRLVDVGAGLLKDEVRVIVTKEVNLATAPAEYRYLALSYCWGKKADDYVGENTSNGKVYGGGPCLRNSHVITSQNLSSYMTGIAMTDLPATIRDAFVVVRQLGMRYIWIDALCILQDSVEDWERESAQMGHIYANAHCTIAASSASHSNGGILHPRTLGRCFAVSIGASDTAKIAREVAKLAHFQLPSRETHANSRTSGSNGESLAFYAMNSDWDKPLWRNPLSSRGWALQEQHLSTRILYYTEEEVYWQCCCFSASEQLPNGLLADPQMTKSYRIFDDLRTESRPELVSSRWFSLVNDVTGREFTESLDLLPALSGIAGEIEQLTGDTYFAGLWKGNIFMCLLWRGPFQGKRSVKYRAPTWSWASVEGRITFIDFYKGYDQKYELSFSSRTPRLLNIKAEPVGLDPRGRLASGYISLACHIKSARYTFSRVSQPIGKHYSRKHNSGILTDLSTEQEVGAVWLDVKSENANVENVIEIALLQYVTREQKQKTYLHHGIGLALRKTGKRGNEYQRVGIAYDILMYWFAQGCKEEAITIV